VTTLDLAIHQTLALAETLKKLRQEIASTDKPVSDLDRISQIVAIHFGISLKDILGKRRPVSIVWPRQVMDWCAVNGTIHNHSEISRAYGVDHATIFYACRVVKDRMDSYPAVKTELDALLLEVQREIAALNLCDGIQKNGVCRIAPQKKENRPEENTLRALDIEAGRLNVVR
jgi:transposase-like protein